ncbi:arginase, partial [Marivivens donghaensis]
MTHVILIGAPVDCGKRRRGCLMGPDAYRVARLPETVTNLGHTVEDIGNLAPAKVDAGAPNNPVVHMLDENVGWTQTLAAAALEHAPKGLPIFMGGDHALSLGSVSGIAAHAEKEGRPLYILWLDAHTDVHTPDTSTSGNLHGTPVGYVTGREGFDAFPPLTTTIPVERVGMIGLRSVDPEERAFLEDSDNGSATLVDMRTIDEVGIAKPLGEFLERVKADNAMLHVSLDVDFLDPSVAPAVGTTVPGGATVREAHLVMEMLCDSGLVTSLDLV